MEIYNRLDNNANVAKYGSINKIQDLRDIIAAHGIYSYYYNQKQTQATTFNSFSGNCADWANDVILLVMRVLCLKCRGAHLQVLCSDGEWYGHYTAEKGVQGSLVFRNGAEWAKCQATNELIGVNGYRPLHYEGDTIPV